MSRRKVKKINNHGVKRLEKRFGISGSNVKPFINNAIKSGINPHELPDGEFKDFLMKKQYATNKRIKVYKNKILIISRTSNNIITAYPIPEEFMTKREEEK